MNDKRMHHRKAISRIKDERVGISVSVITSKDTVGQNEDALTLLILASDKGSTISRTHLTFFQLPPALNLPFTGFETRFDTLISNEQENELNFLLLKEKKALARTFRLDVPYKFDDWLVEKLGLKTKKATGDFSLNDGSYRWHSVGLKPPRDHQCLIAREGCLADYLALDDILEQVNQKGAADRNFYNQQRLPWDVSALEACWLMPIHELYAWLLEDTRKEPQLADKAEHFLLRLLGGCPLAVLLEEPLEL